MKKLTFKTTLYACFAGYIVQAAVNNFLPLLFVTFRSEYGITLQRITMLVTVNFSVQLAVDLLSVIIADRLGYRVCAVLAHAFAAAGFIMLAFLPQITGDPFYGLIICVAVYALGGGLLEVIISPVVEACPTENKEKTMSMLHSFYCWGSVGVIIASALFFKLFGTENWRVMALILSAVPVINGAVFVFTPIFKLTPDGDKGMTTAGLLKSGAFLIFAALMLCAGACELSVSQWASAFAEKGLGISKTAGDIAGPAAFAALMGISRAFYGKRGEKFNLTKCLIYSSCLCAASYMLMVFSKSSVVSLIGCALCGLSVGLMWPGIFSTAAARIKGGGTAMFALLALAGDLGCSAGPGLVGWVSGFFGDNIKAGFFAAMIFPLIFAAGMLALKKTNHQSSV